MNPALIVLQAPESIDYLIQYIEDKDFIAYDCETTGVEIGTEVVGISICAEEDKAFYLILQRWDKESNALIPMSYIKDTSRFIEKLVGKSLVMHNGLFDCTVAQNYFKVNLIESLHTDTMVLAHLLNENRRIALKELAANYFGEDAKVEQAEMKESVYANGGKLTKDTYEMYKADAELLGKYGAKDAWLTYKLFLTMVPELYEQNLDKFFYEEESMPLLRGPTFQLNNVGLKIDRDMLISLKKQLESEILQAKAFIDSEIASSIKERYPGTNKSNKFNIGSNQQLAWLLFGKLCLEFGTLTKEGKAACKSMGLRIPYVRRAKNDFIAICENNKGEIYQPEALVNGKVVKAKKCKDPWAYIAVDKETLTKLASKYKWIEKLLEVKKKTKILETYVVGIEERTKYGVIHPSFLQTGTTSGRYSSRNPNFQNLPRDDKRIKSCIIVRPGKVFVGADYSQLEPRVFAYTSGDQRLLSAFSGTDDFYSVIGMEVYNKTDCTPQKEGSPDAFGIKYKKLRDLSKTIALASTYGATAHRLAPTTGKSIDDTQQDIDNYFERFPDVAKMMLESHDQAKKQGQVTNLFGRPRRIPDAKKITKIYGDISHNELPYDARKLLNLAVNHRIQSTGASIVNRSAIQFTKNCLTAGINCSIVLQVHDSLIVECDEKDANDVSALLQDAMENTVVLPGVKLEAVPKIGKNLSEV